MLTAGNVPGKRNRAPPGFRTSTEPDLGADVTLDDLLFREALA
jgi:hypothetical protein